MKRKMLLLAGMIGILALTGCGSKSDGATDASESVESAIKSGAEEIVDEDDDEEIKKVDPEDIPEGTALKDAIDMITGDKYAHLYYLCTDNYSISFNDECTVESLGVNFNSDERREQTSIYHDNSIEIRKLDLPSHSGKLEKYYCSDVDGRVTDDEESEKLYDLYGSKSSDTSEISDYDMTKHIRTDYNFDEIFNLPWKYESSNDEKITFVCDDHDVIFKYIIKENLFGDILTGDRKKDYDEGLLTLNNFSAYFVYDIETELFVSFNIDASLTRYEEGIDQDNVTHQLTYNFDTSRKYEMYDIGTTVVE